MDVAYLIDTFDRESQLLEATLRNHRVLRPLFTSDFAGADLDAVRLGYLQLLKLSADYVRYTVPALRAAGEALRMGDDEDRGFSEHLLQYARGETDETAGYEHHIWARQDMIALGATAAELEAPQLAGTALYGQYFVDDAARHPYAILGAKGVLEHLSVRSADDLVAGLRASGIPNADRAITFVHHHGSIDIDHVRDGDRNLARLSTPAKRRQVLEGAYVTSGAYRSFIHQYLGR